MNNTENTQLSKQVFRGGAMTMALVALVAMPELVFAQSGSDAAGRVESFFDNIYSLLNIASIAIVTIAVIFAGYQIAFNHKRIGDVAPVLIGGFLIGAAAQIAKMLLPDELSSSTMVMVQLLQYA